MVFRYLRKSKRLKKNFQDFFVFLFVFIYLFFDFGFQLNPIKIEPQAPKAEAAAGEIILLWPASSTPTGWTCISCTNGDPFFQVFPRASSTYASATTTPTLNHSLTYSTSTGPSVTTSSGEVAGSSVPGSAHNHGQFSGTTSDAVSIDPVNFSFRFIKASTTTLPAGIIGMFDVPSTSSLPSGWTYYSTNDTKYLKGSVTTSSGGTSEHNHATPIGMVTASASSTIAKTATTSGLVSASNHTHALTCCQNIAYSSNTPSYVTFVFAQLNATTTLSGTSTPGLIAMFDNTSLPSNWSILSTATSTFAGKLIVASTSGEQTGGSATHNHTGTYSQATQASGATAQVKSGATVNVAASTHTHTITWTVSAETSFPTYRDVILGEYNPGINQANYRWFTNLDSSRVDAIAANPSSSQTHSAGAIAYDASTSAIYAVGSGLSATNTEWRMERRSTSTGALSWVTTTNPSANTDAATAIAIDTASGTMYIAGYDQAQGSTNDEWRIESRSLASGALNYATTSNASGSVDIATGIAINKASSTMYIVGYETLSGSDTRWRIESRNFSNGSLNYATTSNPSTGDDKASAIAIDTASGTMYIAGYDSSSTSGGQVRIEKRNLSNGSLIYSTTTNTTGNKEQMNSLMLDTASGTMYLAGQESVISFASYMRFEKRNTSDGALVYAATTSVAGVLEGYMGVTLNLTSRLAYLVGSAYSSGLRYRIDARNFSDGSISYSTTSKWTSSAGAADIPGEITSDGTNPTYLYVSGGDGSGDWIISKRNASDGGNTWASGALAAAGSSAIAPSQGTPFRLRMLLDVGGGPLATSSGSFKLQFAARSTSCDTSFSGESYADVATSTGAIRFYNNTSSVDGDRLYGTSTDNIDPTYGNHLVVTETYVEQNNFSNPTNIIAASSSGEWDFALVDNSASSGTPYCFRAVKSDGTLLDTYTVIPEIVTAASLTQSGYRWFSNLDSADLDGVIVNPSSNSDAATAIAYDASTNAIYTVGYDGVLGSADFRWRIEARSTTGTLIYATTSAGLDNNAVAQAIAINAASGTMVVVGYEQSFGATDDAWMIQIRNLSDGAVSQNTVLNNSSSVDRATGVAVDSSGGMMYVVGYDTVSGSDTKWVLKRYNMRTGVISYTTSSNPSSEDDQPSAIALDIPNGYMYIAGFDSSPGLNNTEVRVEKRSMSTGALVYATTTNLSSYIDKYIAISLDTTNGAMYLGGNSSAVFGISSFLFDKRSLSDGSVTYSSQSAYGGSSVAHSVLYDPTSSVVYVGGLSYDDAANHTWRLEKRDPSDGSVTASTTLRKKTLAFSIETINGLALDSTNGYIYAAGFDTYQGTTDNEWRIEKYATSTLAFGWGEALAGNNSVATSTTSGIPFRLRMLFHSATGAGTSSQVLKLQFAAQSGTCDTSFTGESYADVVTSTGAVRFYTSNPTPADGDTMATSTIDPTHNSDTLVNQTYETANTFTNSKAIASGTDAEWDFPLVSTSTGTSYCFRAVNSDGSQIGGYTVIPELRMGDYVQSAYRTYGSMDSVDPSGVYENLSGNSSGDAAYGIAYDASTSAIYAAGYDAIQGTGNHEWRIERRTSTGTLVYATTSNPSSNTDLAAGIAINSASGTMYVVGYDQVVSSTNDEWRIEARNLSNGLLLYVATSNPSSSIDRANAIDIDPTNNAMYVVGFETLVAGGDIEWRIEKRTLSSGALVWATTTNPSTGHDNPSDIHVDTVNGYIYISGSDQSPGNLEFRIEKRSASTGALVYATTSNPTSNGDEVSNLAIDVTNDAMYLAGYENGNGFGATPHFEKRTLSTGSFTYSASTTGGIVSIYNAVVVNPTSGIAYVGGQTPTGGYISLTLEARSMSTGDLLFSTTTNANPGALGVAAVNDLALDTTHSTLYAAGTDISPTSTDSAWRIESRSTTDFATNWGAPLAAQDTSSTLPTKGTPFHLRILMHSGGSLAATGALFKLQVAQKSGTCDTTFSGETYADLASGGGEIRLYTNASPINGDTIPERLSDPTHGTDSTIGQDYVSTLLFTNPIALSTGQDGEWDFSLVDNSAPADTSYCFRIVKTDGTLLDTYNVIPEIRSLPLPSTPGTPTYSSIGTSTVTVSWSGSTYADYYSVKRGTSSLAQITTTTNAYYADSSLSASTTYMYQICGVNTQGTGTCSASSSVTMKTGYASGTIESVIIDTAVTNGAAPNSIIWYGSLPASTTVKFQFAGATSTNGPWSYTGWNSVTNSCDASSYYDPGAVSTNVEIKALCQNNLRYLRYKVYLSSTNANATPRVDRIILNYAQ